MRHGSLFSGIGGFDLAADWMGWENVFHCEWNEFVQKILNYYWPKAKSYGDITKTDFTEWRGRIDIVSGGFPCQPYSVAGKRKGKEDERHLWPEMLRAIREIQPRWVVGENVFGLINWSKGLVFHEVQADLEAAGYEVWPYVLPACGVNAPHRRDRIWFVAHAIGDGHGDEHTKAGQKKDSTEAEKQRKEWDEVQREWLRDDDKRVDVTGPTPNPTKANGGEPLQTRTGWNGTSGMGDAGDAADTESFREYRAQKHENDCGQSGESGGCYTNDFGEIQGGGITADTSNQGLQGGEINGGIGRFGENGNKQFAGRIPPTWEVFPTQPPVCGRDYGISGGLDGITVSKHRKESLMAYGNAIVPNVVYQIFKAIEEYENSRTHGKDC